MPDNGSAQVNSTVTAPLFQPARLALGVREALIVGATRSILTVSRFGVSSFPARSTAWYDSRRSPSPGIAALATSPVVLALVTSAPAVTEYSMRSTPESASVARIDAVTFVLFQPLAFAAGAIVAVLAGGVLSVTLHSQVRFGSGGSRRAASASARSHTRMYASEEQNSESR